MTEKSIYVWNMPALPAGRATLRATLLAIGCEKIWVKAGGDDGYAWIPSQINKPGWLRPQWTSDWLAPFQPIQSAPWFYVWPRESEFGAIVRALKERQADEVALNPETEWRVQSSANHFRSLGEANAWAEWWVEQLRAALRATFGREYRIGFSGVPSWADFPYEGFANACDFAHPQHYWPGDIMARGEDQVNAHLRRAGTGKPCVPILTVAREYDDAGAFALAESALRDFPDLDGFSGWVAGEHPFQADVMRRAYLLLPATDGQSNPPRPEGWLNVGQADTFLWPDGEGVIVEREVVYYNGEKRKYYRRTWHHERGYGDWEEIA